MEENRAFLNIRVVLRVLLAAFIVVVLALLLVRIISSRQQANERAQKSVEQKTQTQEHNSQSNNNQQSETQSGTNTEQAPQIPSGIADGLDSADSQTGDVQKEAIPDVGADINVLYSAFGVAVLTYVMAFQIKKVEINF